MQIIFFTKFLRGQAIEAIGEVAGGLGFDGLDLAIRAGHAVNPENVATALPEALRTWAACGLSVPLATLEAGTTNPASPDTERIFAACGAAGIPYIKLGYWLWNAATPYWGQVDAIRRDLEAFQRLGQRYGVCSLVHTHSDACYASNASGALHLVKGFDAQHIAVYLDPAHLALDGEYLPMGLDIARDYLRMVGVKNARYLAKDAGWTTDFCLLSEGLVNWTAAIAQLRNVGYDGPLNLHGEYSIGEEWTQVLTRVKMDLPYLRSCVSGTDIETPA